MLFHNASKMTISFPRDIWHPDIGGSGFARHEFYGKDTQGFEADNSGMVEQSASRPALGAAFRLPDEASRAMAARAVQTAPVILALFMASVILPVSVELGGLRLTPIRIVLLLSIVPLFFQLVTGRLGKFLLADLLLMFAALWMIVSLYVTEGSARFSFSVISAIELFGGYLLGRYLVRNAADFKAMVKWHLWALAIMAPFAVIEFVTGTQYWARILDIFGDVVYRGRSSEPRLGFDRVLAGFEHPILYGVYCSMAAATTFYIWRATFLRATVGFVFITFMTFMSLSSGAIISIMLQSVLIGWDMVMKGRWKLFASIVLSLYVFLEVASNRGAMVIFIDTLTLNQSTAWTRVAQWQYGSAEVLRNPIWGKGFDPNWIRPGWLHTASIDNYWLVVGFRHGFPGIVPLVTALALIAWRIMAAKDLTPEAARMRTGYMIVLIGVCFSLSTVHVWDASVVHFYFYVGCGLWFAEAGARAFDGDGSGPLPEAPAPDLPTSRYTRFSPVPAGPGRSARSAAGQSQTASVPDHTPPGRPDRPVLHRAGDGTGPGTPAPRPSLRTRRRTP